MWYTSIWAPAKAWHIVIKVQCRRWVCTIHTNPSFYVPPHGYTKCKSDNRYILLGITNYNHKLWYIAIHIHNGLSTFMSCVTLCMWMWLYLIPIITFITNNMWTWIVVLKGSKRVLGYTGNSRHVHRCNQRKHDSHNTSSTHPNYSSLVWLMQFWSKFHINVVQLPDGNKLLQRGTLELVN